ncbi:MAG: DUF2207 domain-containing protein [Candidatus Pacearchaeota archaeon]|jgi:hypothetical protein
MKESRAVAIFVAIFILLGILSLFYFIFFSAGFNFYKSELTINGNNVQEKLTFNANKDYHTLFRTFITPVVVSPSNFENIQLTSVSCQQGTPYVYTQNSGLFTFDKTFTSEKSLPYTEINEYGCTFGNQLGFKKSQDYTIQSSFIVNNKNLFEINGKYYTKFVAYSPDKHKLLIKNNNFFVSGDAITKDIFFPNEYVIIYIPYNEKDISQFNIIQKSNFEFTSIFIFILFIIFSFFPAILFFLVWFIWGRETSYLDVPKELSMYPNQKNDGFSFFGCSGIKNSLHERKAWEVATMFTHPLGKINNNFFPAMIMDMNRRKIIELKAVDKEVYIKLLKYNKQKLDEVELAFISYIEKIIELGDKSKIDSEGFFSVKKMINTIKFTKQFELQKEYQSLAKTIDKKSKEYLDKKGQTIIILSMIALFSLSFLFFALTEINFIPLIILLFISLFITLFASNLSSIFIKFKKDYYIEYQKWQGFKHYLNAFSSMKTCPPEAIKLWQQHLVYATALGVGAVVIKKFREWRVINETQYAAFYNTTAYSTSNFGGAAAGSGGGMGGAGGGGAGGGGGGGR